MIALRLLTIGVGVGVAAGRAVGVATGVLAGVAVAAGVSVAVGVAVAAGVSVGVADALLSGFEPAWLLEATVKERLALRRLKLSAALIECRPGFQSWPTGMVTSKLPELPAVRVFPAEGIWRWSGIAVKRLIEFCD